MCNMGTGVPVGIRSRAQGVAGHGEGPILAGGVTRNLGSSRLENVSLIGRIRVPYIIVDAYL